MPSPVLAALAALYVCLPVTAHTHHIWKSASHEPPRVWTEAGSLSQFGITWTFDRSYSVGRFANGDWWVVGPVTITRIDPASVSGSRAKNGSMVNPSPRNNNQGYDSATTNVTYSATLNVALDVSSSQPLVLQPGSSLVSTISVDTAGSRPQVRTAAVLTVLDVPAPEGSFRPPYAGGDKSIRFNVAQLDYGLLRRLRPVPSTPSLSSIERRFERPWIDHKGSWTGRYLHPKDNMPDYGRDIATWLGDGALMLHLDFDEAQKETLLIRYVQIGIDFYGIIENGGERNWAPLEGHCQGRKWPILFAGMVLGDAAMAGIGSRQDVLFSEDGQTFYVSETSPGVINYGHGGYSVQHLGMPEWGKRHATNPSRDDVSWSVDYRQCCTANSFVGHVLAARIMNAKGLWNHDALFDYQERYMQIQLGAASYLRSMSDFSEEMWDSYSVSRGSASPPTFTPRGGSYPSPVSVVLESATAGSEIRYTLDGSIPDQSSSVYAAPIFIASTTLLRARTFAPNLQPSSIAEAQFTIGSGSNRPPTALAGPDVRVAQDQEVTLNGSASFDPDGNPLSATWTQISGPTLSGFNGSQFIARFTPRETGIYGFRLQVDDGQAQATDDVEVTVVRCLNEVEDDLIGRWRFDEASGDIAWDSSAGAAHGRLAGAQRTSGGPFATSGSAALFAGSDDRVQIEGPLDLGGDALTCTAWIRFDAFGNDERILSKAVGTAEQDHELMISTRPVGGVRRLRFRLRTGGRTDTLIASSGDLRTGVWTHIVAWYDGQEMRIYKDGVVVGRMAKSGSIPSSLQLATAIGNQPSGAGSRPLVGAIDDVRIYGRALSDPEIAQLGAADLGQISSSCGCATDLGSGGPGEVTLSACIQPDPLPEGSLEIRLSGAIPNQFALLMFSLQSQPLGLFGGTLLAHPAEISAVVTVGSDGIASYRDMPRSGSGNVYIQSLGLHPDLPSGAWLSNAVLVELPM